MKLSTTLLLALSGLTFALASPSSYSPKSKRQDEAPGTFRVVANKPDTDIDSLFMEARGRSFWLGGDPSTYCPTTVGDACPPGKVTVIAGLNNLVRIFPGSFRISRIMKY